LIIRFSKLQHMDGSVIAIWIVFSCLILVVACTFSSLCASMRRDRRIYEIGSEDDGCQHVAVGTCVSGPVILPLDSIITSTFPNYSPRLLQPSRMHGHSAAAARPIVITEYPIFTAHPTPSAPSYPASSGGSASSISAPSFYRFTFRGLPTTLHQAQPATTQE
jgi:hypothetical protein